MALYRFPFPAEANPSTWYAGGNWDQGGHAAAQGDNPTDEQAYAYDIGHATGGKILAARAGEVIDLDERWPDDTHPADGTPGPGNYVWIRHGDGTMAAYLHLKHNSVRVSKGQYVFQGTWIAESGNTGQSGGPHLHFDVHTYGEPGKTSAPGLGTQLLVHFEDKTRVSFRPQKGEALSGKSNNVAGELRQDNWRHCVKCRTLYFAPSPGSTCPEDHQEHEHDGGGNYTLALVGDVELFGDPTWRYCGKCHALFSTTAASVCPAGPGKAHTDAGGDYVLAQDMRPVPGHQGGWRLCVKCAVLWFQAAGSRCPATNGAHSAGDGDYQLHHTEADWQRGWRRCANCAGLFYGPNIASSRCPKYPGAPHVVHQDPSYTHNYFLALNSPDAPGQPGWRWCGRCQGLWMGDNAGSSCPATGPHEKAGSGNYTVIHDAEDDGPGEKGWRWCGKCQGLWMGGAGSSCPVDGSHAKGGGLYRVQYDGHA